MHRHLYTASGINHGENHRDTKEFVLSVRIRDDAITIRLPLPTVYKNLNLDGIYIKYALLDGTIYKN